MLIENRQISVISDFRREEMRTAVFWVITQRVVVISYRRFGTTYRSHLQGSKITGKHIVSPLCVNCVHIIETE
jgi:hypothetical protein